MSARRLPLIVGIGEDQRLVPIRRAQRGLKCNCVCPCCGARLSAKRGKIKAHHFAHHQAEECTGAVETALHRFAKAVIHHHRELVLPPIVAHGMERPIRPVQVYPYRRTGEEIPLKGFVADVVAYGFQKLVIELKVSHEVDNYKQRVFIRSGIRSVEIDVLAIFEELANEGRAEDTRELARRIIRFGEREGGFDVHGRWLFHPAQHNAEFQRRKKARVLKVRQSVWRGYRHYHTQGCPSPEHRRVAGGDGWKRFYARTHQDCAGCPHLVELDYDFAWVGYRWLPIRLSRVRCGFQAK